MLVHTKQIPVKNDDTEIQFQQFLFNDVKENKENFLSLVKTKRQLDVFLHEYVGKAVEYKQMWKTIQFILTTSLDQADVERGFSVNKELIVENVQEELLISQELFM